MFNLKNVAGLLSKAKAASRSMLSIVLVLCLLAVMLPTGIGVLSAVAENDTPVPWDGTIGEAFAGGDGSAADPYQISNGNELAYLAKRVNDDGATYSGKYFKLTADIDLNDQSWAPIGWSKGTTTAKAFYGIFDGDGHTITGLNYDRNRVTYFNASTGEVIHELQNNAEIAAYGAETGLTPYKNDSNVVVDIFTKKTTTVVNGTALTANSYGRDSLGVGLFGRVSGATIKNLNVEGSVVTDQTTVGGLVGYANGTTVIDNCSFTGTVEAGSYNWESATGGLIGYISGGTTTITNCTVDNTTVRSTMVELYPVATIDGDDTNGYTITVSTTKDSGCWTNGMSNGGFIGHITGGAVVTITGSCATDLTLTGGNHNGGLVGVQRTSTNGNGSLTIEKCYTTGTISGTYSGGLVGTERADANASNTLTLRNSYSVATLSGSNSGGLFGGLHNNSTNGYCAQVTVTMENCFYAGTGASYPIAYAYKADGVTWTTGTVSRVYYLDTLTASNASKNYTHEQIVAKSADDFKNDVVTDLLNASSAQGEMKWWKQGDTYPVHAVAPQLTGLSVSCDSISFNSTQYTYSVLVSNEVTSATVTATADEPNTISINGGAATLGTVSEEIELPPDTDTTITVNVTRDGNTIPYTVTITTTSGWDGSMEPFANYDADSTLFNPAAGSAQRTYVIENAKQLAFLAYIVNNHTYAHGNSGTYEVVKNAAGTECRQVTVDVDTDRDGTPEPYYFHAYGGYFLRGAKFVLTADIELNDQPWEPIGYSKSVIATFDGDGHTISGLNVSGSYGYAGLFGYTVAQTKIMNLTVSGNVSTTGAYAGGIVGYTATDSTTGLSLVNCTFNGNVSAGRRAGGLVGGMVMWSATNASAFTLTNCYSSGTVQTTDAGTVSAVGGLVGAAPQKAEIAGSVTFNNCASTMTVSAANRAAGTVVAGLCAEVVSSTTYSPNLIFNNCFFAGTAVNSSVPIAKPSSAPAEATVPAASATYVYYKAGSITGDLTGVAATEIADTNSDFAATLNANVDSLANGGLDGLRYWSVNEDGVLYFATMPELSGLELDCGTIAFDKSTLTYSVSVSNEVEKATVTARAEEPNTISINGGAATPGTASAEVALTRNSTKTITVDVSNADFTVTYTLLVSTSGTVPNLVPEPFANYSVESAGTASDPYTIENAAQLYFLALTANVNSSNSGTVAFTIGDVDYKYSNYNSKYFVLTSDIDWENEPWLPIGGYTPFSGNFDGGNHTVSNVNCTLTEMGHMGFFAYLSGATVKNLYIENASFKHDAVSLTSSGGTANPGIGGVAGTITAGTTLTNVHFNGTITVTANANDNSYVGGIVGFASGTSTNALFGCSTTGTINAVKRYTGGLVGLAWCNNTSPTVMTISGCYSAMDITNLSKESETGGLVGGISTIAEVSISSSHFAGTTSSPYPISPSAHLVVNDDVYVREGWYTGTKAIAGAGIDEADPTARVKTVAEFAEGGTVTGLLNETSVGATLWKDGTEYPLNITATGDSLVTGVMITNAAVSLTEGTYAYELFVPYSSDTVALMPMLVEGTTATVNGVAIESGKVSQEIPLEVGVAQSIYLRTSLGDVINNYLFVVTRREKVADGVWDGGYEAFDTSDKKGEAIDNPIVIENAEQLAFFAAMVNGKSVLLGTTVYTPPEKDADGRTVYTGVYFKLGADIKLNDLANYENWGTEAPANLWEPIGYWVWQNEKDSRMFAGILDGDSHTVSGLYINTSSTVAERGNGLFGAVSGAVIRNLHVKQAYISAMRSAGGIVGLGMYGTPCVTLQNCSFSGTVISRATSGDAKTGGLIGDVYPQALINSCWSEGTIVGGNYTGGFIGRIRGYKGLDILNSYSAMTIQSAYESAEYIGGLVGALYSSLTGPVTIRGSHFAGTVPNGKPIVGGVAANATYTIESVYFRDDSYVGSLDETTLLDAVEKTAEEFADGTVTALLNDAVSYGDIWAWEDGENGYPVSDGVLLVTDFRDHTDDSQYDHDTSWANKFVNKDGGTLKGQKGGSSTSDDDVLDGPITGEGSLYISVIVLLLISVVAVLVLVRKRNRVSE